MRHGLTLGELGLWFVKKYKIDVNYHLIEMVKGAQVNGSLVYSGDTANKKKAPKDTMMSNTNTGSMVNPQAASSPGI